MTDREKVIRGLEVCSTVEDLAPCPNECPYNKPDAVCYGTARLMQDALTMLREQEPRLLSVDEVKALPPDTDVYVENGTFDNGPRYLLAATKEGVGGTNGVSFFYFTRLWRDYNKLPYGWRVWTARPDNEYRRAVEWDA